MAPLHADPQPLDDAPALAPDAIRGQALPGPTGTKAERLARLQAAWAELQAQAQLDVVTRDQERGQLLSHTLQEEVTEDEQLTEREIGEALGISQRHVSDLVRYSRFMSWQREVNSAIALFDIPEGRFRAYWKACVDTQASRGKRTPAHRQRVEQETFTVIARYLAEGKPPPTIRHTKPRLTVEEMCARKKPLEALRKELEEAYTPELTKIIERGKELLKHDRSTYTPSFLAHAFIALDTWHRHVLDVMRAFDSYTH